jgi:hypothetical protein
VRDSRNHPVWKRLCEAEKTQSITKKVRKSKRLLMGPNQTMKRCMNRMFIFFGLST